MPLPGDLTTCVLTGTFTDPAGNPMRGTVTICPNATLTDATGNVIVSQLQRAYQLFNGSFTTAPLVATDNADINPQGFAYVITIALQEVETYSFTVLLPHSPSPVDLSALSPAVLNLPDLASYLSMTGGTLTGKLTLDGSIPLQIPAGAAAGDVLTSDASGNASWSSVSADGIATASALAAETSRAETAEGLLAPKASPALTGTPTAPTASALANSTQIATTAYTDSAAAAASAAAIAASLPTLAANVSVSASGTLAANTVTEVSAGSNLTMTLPSSVAGNVIVVEKSDSSTNTVGITGNIRGVGSSTVTLKLQNESEMFLGYAGSWWPVAGHKTLGSLDSRYGQLATASTYTADQYFKSGRPWVDVRAYGAAGNTQIVATGAMSSSSSPATLTATGAGFAAADVGKTVNVTGAGAAGAVLATTISAYVSSTQVTLAAAASTTVSAAQVVWGTDDTTAIQAALTAVATSPGGMLLFPYGRHLVTSTLTVTGMNLMLQGLTRVGNYHTDLGRTGGAEIIAAAGFSGSTLFNCTASDVTQPVGFEGLSLNGNSACTSAITYTSNIGPQNSVEWCLVYGFTGDAIVLANNNYNGLIANNFIRDNAGYGIKLGPGTQSNDIRGNYFARNGGHIWVSYTTGSSDPSPVWISHNAFGASVQVASTDTPYIRCDRGEIIIENNYIEADTTVSTRSKTTMVQIGVNGSTYPVVAQVNSNRFNLQGDMANAITVTSCSSLRIFCNSGENIPSGGYLIKASGGFLADEWEGWANIAAAGKEYDTVAQFSYYRDITGITQTFAQVTSGFRTTAATTGTIAFQSRVSGDTNDRIRMSSSTIQFGSGGGAPDTNLYRVSGVGGLQTDANFTVGGTLSLGTTAISAPPGGTTSFLAGNGTWVTPAGGVTLDITTGDIQASPGTAAAGSEGLAADAKHVHPQPPMFAPSGLTGATAASRYVGATTGGPPTSGTFATGDWVVDQTGCTWLCTSGGTSGTWMSPQGDPWGVGENLNYLPPEPQVVTGAMGTASKAVYTRFYTYGYSMSSVTVYVVAQSGNVCAAIYAPNSSTPGVPGARVLTSGSVACGTGGAKQTISLGGSVTIGRGYWVGFIADNTSATFRQLGSVAVPGDSSWIQADSSAGTFPLASGTPTTASGTGLKYPILASVA